MNRPPRRRDTRRLLLAAGVATAAWLAPAGCQRQESAIPEQLSDTAFWSLVNGLSEEGGYFHSDNFVSNELAFQYVLPELAEATGNDVYVGVGPDQNFTYLVALRPRIAFIVDIRRQNLLQHLMYKALIELSSDRADFLGRLFSRSRLAPAPDDQSADALFSWLATLPRDTVLFERNLGMIGRHLKEKGMALDAFDMASLEYVYSSFYHAGPALTYSSNVARGFGGRGMPTYRTLMTATDQDGVNRGYLGSEENFGILKDMQARNLIVPVVGDFAGPKALREVGNWVRQQNATIRTFYVSNVEQYLFQQGDAWRRFYDNVSDMPMHRDARFVRSVSNRGYRRQHPFARSASTTSDVEEVLGMFRSGRLQSYADIVDLSR